MYPSETFMSFLLLFTLHRANFVVKIPICNFFILRFFQKVKSVKTVIVNIQQLKDMRIYKVIFSL